MEGTAAFAYAPQRIRDVVPPALQEGLDKTHHRRWLSVHTMVWVSLYSLPVNNSRSCIVHAHTHFHSSSYFPAFS